jgi:hypothetical protein
MMSGPHISGKEVGAGDVFGQRHLCYGEVAMGGNADASRPVECQGLVREVVAY